MICLRSVCGCCCSPRGSGTNGTISTGAGRAVAGLGDFSTVGFAGDFLRGGVGSRTGGVGARAGEGDERGGWCSTGGVGEAVGVMGSSMRGFGDSDGGIGLKRIVSTTFCWINCCCRLRIFCDVCTCFSTRSSTDVIVFVSFSTRSGTSGGTGSAGRASSGGGLIGGSAGSGAGAGEGRAKT